MKSWRSRAFRPSVFRNKFIIRGLASQLHCVSYVRLWSVHSKPARRNSHAIPGSWPCATGVRDVNKSLETARSFVLGPLIPRRHLTCGRLFLEQRLSLASIERPRGALYMESLVVRLAESTGSLTSRHLGLRLRSPE